MSSADKRIGQAADGSRPAAHLRSMSTVDAVGNLHNQSGQFAGHIKTETDPAVLGEPDMFLGAFEPFAHQPVECGRFEVNDRFYAEVIAAGAFGRKEPTVSFYDKHHPQWGNDGQFVSNYYISTLRQSDEGDRRNHGLNLHFGVPAWQIPADDYATVLDELARRAPSFDGRTHSLNPDALELLDADQQEHLAVDLADRPIPGEDRTLAELIRILGVHKSGVAGDGPNMVRFGDGRTADVHTSTVVALSDFPRFWIAERARLGI